MLRDVLELETPRKSDHGNQSFFPGAVNEIAERLMHCIRVVYTSEEPAKNELNVNSAENLGVRKPCHKTSSILAGARIVDGKVSQTSRARVRFLSQLRKLQLNSFGQSSKSRESVSSLSLRLDNITAATVRCSAVRLRPGVRIIEAFRKRRQGRYFRSYSLVRRALTPTYTRTSWMTIKRRP